MSPPTALRTFNSPASTSAAVSNSWRLSGGRRDPRRERRLQSAAQRKHLWHRPLGGSLGIAERHRKLEQRQWVPFGFGEQPVPDRRCERGKPSCQELRRGVFVQRMHREFRNAGRVEGVLAFRSRGTEERDVADVQTTSDERQHGGAGAIDPLEIVDDQQQRSCRAAQHEQPEHGIRYDHGVGCSAGGDTQRDRERTPVILAQDREIVGEWQQRLIEGREARLRLDLDPRSMEDERARSCSFGAYCVEERRLSDARLTDQDEGAPIRCASEHIEEDAQLNASAFEPGRVRKYSLPLRMTILQPNGRSAEPGRRSYGLHGAR